MGEDSGTSDKNKWWSLGLLGNKYPALHGLRVLSFVSIIQIHVTTQMLKYLKPEKVSDFSIASMNIFMAVDFFFVLSGFLITRIIYRHVNFESETRARGSLIRFYIRRALRLLPVYFFFLLGFFFIQQVGIYEPIGGAKTLHWKEIFFLTNYPFDFKYVMSWSWTLSVEEQFYLVSPFIIFVMTRFKSFNGQAAFLLLLWCLAPLVRYLSISSYEGPWVYGKIFENFYTPSHMRFDPFIAGIFLALLEKFRGEKLSKWVNNFRWKNLMIYLPLLVLALMALPSLNPQSEGFYVLIEQSTVKAGAYKGIFYHGTLTSLAYVFIFLFCIYVKKSPFIDFLGHRKFRILATFAYSVYIVHYPIIDIIGSGLLPYFELSESRQIPQALWWITFLCTLLASVVVAYVLHLIVEKPTMKLREKYFPELKKAN